MRLEKKLGEDIAKLSRQKRGMYGVVLLFGHSFSVGLQIFVSHLLRKHELLVLFRYYADAFFSIFKFKECDNAVLHELCTYGPAHEARKFLSA